MLEEELLFNFKTKLKASESVVNWPICLVLSITQNMEFLFITTNNSSKHASLSTHQRPHNGGSFYYFLYCDLIEYQSIGNQRAPLLQITPAVENITSNVKSIQFEHLYHYRVSKNIITHIVPEIRSEFGELVQFKHTDPLYVFHFRPRVYEIL